MPNHLNGQLNFPGRSFFQSPARLRLPNWLTSYAPGVLEQAERVRTMERNIVLPVKAAVLLLLVYYMFFSNWFEDVYTFHLVVLKTFRLFFLIYLVVNLISGTILIRMETLPFTFIREVVLTTAVIDGLFWGALTMVTGGFDSVLYWGFLGLIVRNAVSLPVASTQIVLNLMLCGWFVTAGLTEVAITSIESKSIEPEQSEASNEPYVMRGMVLLLMTACCYGVQVLFEKQRRADEETREFIQRQQQLQSAGRLAAEVAHQIKNPLAIINNAAFSLQRALYEGKSGAAQQVEIIQEEVARADQIITQIMGYAQLSEGRVEKLSVTEELDRAIEQVFPRAVPGGVSIQRRYATDFPPLLMLRRHLFEIFANLLQNAREALNGKGNMVVTAECHGDYSVEVSVQDDGPGIAPDKLEQIFEAYYTAKERGTGLGLAIVKHNVELYGGSVRVESELGKGAKFTLLFPAKTLMRLNK
jgi:signal transduction histidine kinase